MESERGRGREKKRVERRKRERERRDIWSDDQSGEKMAMAIKVVEVVEDVSKVKRLIENTSSGSASSTSSSSLSRLSSTQRKAKIDKSETSIYKHRRTDFVWLEHKVRCSEGGRSVPSLVYLTKMREERKVFTH